ncbi:MAG TPA: 30S ribosomal protein S16 [Armatimonadetes bacterium]|nr:30S ribosomal protein S16 [Armatimonadota bacterium]
MSVKIRLRRMGSRGKPFYRIVVADSRTARNGRFIELLGHYDPCTDPVTVKIDEERALLWLGRGAQTTDTAAALLKKESIMEKFLATKGVKDAKKAPAPKAESEATKAPARKRRTKAAAEETEATEAEPQTAAEAEVAPEAQPDKEQG